MDHDGLPVSTEVWGYQARGKVVNTVLPEKCIRNFVLRSLVDVWVLEFLDMILV